MARLDGSVQERAMRYIVLQDVYGHPHQVAREYCHLPERLAKAIDLAILEKVDGSVYQVREKLRGQGEKMQKYLNFCIECYRDYYRSRSNNKTQLQEG